jgi:adenine-specific DNA-methyltransferase
MCLRVVKRTPEDSGQPLSEVSGCVYTGNKLHPTQKRVEVLEPLIRTYCPTGGIVLDPFCGSGWTLVAAETCGRRYVGIELDPDRAEVARHRLPFIT